MDTEVRFPLLFNFDAVNVLAGRFCRSGFDVAGVARFSSLAPSKVGMVSLSSLVLRFCFLYSGFFFSEWRVRFLPFSPAREFETITIFIFVKYRCYFGFVFSLAP